MRITTILSIAMAFTGMAFITQAQEIHMNVQKEEVLATIELMTTAFAKGDIDTIMSTYAPDAVVVGEPGKRVAGDTALRAMFASYMEAGIAFTYGAHDVVISGNTALHLMKWTAPQPDGSEASALSVAVLHRQPDGRWKMVIDHPFGNAVMEAH